MYFAQAKMKIRIVIILKMTNVRLTTAVARIPNRRRAVSAIVRMMAGRLSTWPVM